jgi:hypothetical protein
MSGLKIAELRQRSLFERYFAGDIAPHTPLDPAPDKLSAHAASGKQAPLPAIASVPKSFHSPATAQPGPFGRYVELPCLSPSWLLLARHMNALKGMESKLKETAEKWVSPKSCSCVFGISAFYGGHWVY